MMATRRSPGCTRTEKDVPATSPLPIEDQAFRKALLTWYDQHRRQLPWRETSDPYAILVSELMLQQTQVKTVIPYYDRFLEQFPTPSKLANAPEETVLRAWQGLGYYRRARYLHAAAKKIDDEHQGHFPKTKDEIDQLPGVGTYTSAAVSSIAFQMPYACVDGNVIRVLTRLHAVDDEVETATTKRLIQDTAQRLLDPTRPGDYNQAMMELGATMCTPRQPNCLTCPVNAFCSTYQNGDQPECRPVKKKKSKAQKIVYECLLLIDGDRFLAGRRNPHGLMAGMWELPAQVLDDALPWSDLLSGSLEFIGTLKPVQHQFTHLHATYRVSVFRASDSTWLKQPNAYDQFNLVDLTTISDLPKTKVLRKLMPSIHDLLQGDSPCPNDQSNLPGL